MKKFFSKIRPYISFSKKGLFSAMVFVGILFTLYHERPAQAGHDDNRAARRGLLGGITGAGVGYAIGGPAGAAGLGIGGVLIGSQTGRRSSGRKLDRLYKKRDRLKQDIQEAKTDKRRARYEKDLKKVNDDISRREGPRHG